MEQPQSVEWKTWWSCYGCGKAKDGPGPSPCPDPHCKWVVTVERLQPK